MARGFTYAGSASVITSLWNVREEANNAIILKFYEGLEATAQKMLKKFGFPVILRTYERSSGYNPTVTETNTSVVAVDNGNQQTGLNVSNVVRQLLVSTEGVTAVPTTGDAIVIDGIVNQIDSVEPLSPGGRVLPA